MGEDEDKIAASHEPPQTGEEWRVIRDGVDKSHKAWLIVGPIHAVVTNWKAILVVVFVIAWLNNPRILAAIAEITRVPQ